MKVGDLVRRKPKRGDARVTAPLGRVGRIEADGTVAVVSKATGGRCATVSRWPAKFLQVVTEDESADLRQP